MWSPYGEEAVKDRAEHIPHTDGTYQERGYYKPMWIEGTTLRLQTGYKGATGGATEAV